MLKKIGVFIHGLMAMMKMVYWRYKIMQIDDYVVFNYDSKELLFLEWLLALMVRFSNGSPSHLEWTNLDRRLN